MAERALSDRLSLQHTLMDTLPIPVFVKDRDGLFTEVNRAFEAILGTRRDTLLGRKASDDSRFPPHIQAAFDETDRKALGTGEAQQIEAQFAFPDGRDHTLILTKAPIEGTTARSGASSEQRWT